VQLSGELRSIARIVVSPIPIAVIGASRGLASAGTVATLARSELHWNRRPLNETSVGIQKVPFAPTASVSALAGSRFAQGFGQGALKSRPHAAHSIDVPRQANANFIALNKRIQLGAPISAEVFVPAE
jgi:hypothetical protein